MGALDSSDPSWRDLPIEVRQRALDDATELEQLVRIAIGDPDSKLGLRAVARISDDALLADVACLGAKFAVAEAALACVRAPALLARIAIEAKYTYIRAGAVDRIDDQPWLVEIAMKSHCTTTSPTAAGRIRYPTLRAVVARQAVCGAARVAAAGRDPALLAEIATNDRDPEARRLAVTKVTDDALIARVARRDPDVSVREAALRCLHDAPMVAQIALEDADPRLRILGIRAIEHGADQAVLASVAVRDPDVSVREAALRCLHDAPTVAQIALEDAEPRFRILAIERGTDQGVLASIAVGDPDADVREAAVRRLRNKTILTHIASDDPEPIVRRAAVAGVEEQSVLAQIAHDDPDPSVRRAATQRLDDQGLLANIAVSDPDPNVRHAALYWLDDQHLLANIAVSDLDPNVRHAALYRLGDQHLLANIALSGPDPEVRLQAARRLDDQHLLANIAVSDPHLEVRRAAIERLIDDKHLFGFMLHADPVLRIAAADRLLELDRGRRRRRETTRTEHPAEAAAARLSELPDRDPILREVRVLEALALEHSSEAVRRAAMMRLAGMRTEQPDGDVVLPEMLAAARPRRQSRVAGAEPVDFSLFGPPAMAAGSTIMLQVFLHRPEQADEAAGLAKGFDTDAERRGFRSLETDLQLGSLVVFQVILPELEIDQPLKAVVWGGRTDSVQFAVKARKGLSAQSIVGKVRALQDGVPIGHILFKLEVTERRPVADEQSLGDAATRHRYAFVSYASADRNEMLKRVQMLKIAGIEFFQDLIELKPGQRWQRELYRHIDRSDLFLLFWSKAARRSRWVLEEVRYAIGRKKGDEEAPPEIVPVILGEPPPVKPPPDLAHLHFNDPIIYFMQ